jgi:cellulose synthase/poly-beta-1,6-N-acetylglucosamine synthase-like glycosyltransferase
MKSLFWISATLVGYSYLGYPAWLWLRARWSPRPVRRGPITPSVSVVMVVRNEEAALARKLNNLIALEYPADKLEIVVVCDGSNDRTASILSEYASHLHAGRRVVPLLKSASQGKAAGLNDAIKVANGEILLFTDARQQIEPGALQMLVENFCDPAVGAASGELMLGDTSMGETDKGMGLYWRVEKEIRELESIAGSVAGATGAIYCARRNLLVASPLPEGTILDDVLLPMQIIRQGSRVIFDSRARAWDSPDLGDGREFSRKVRTLSGNYQLLQLAPWLLTSEDSIRFEFISHKLSRLAVPFGLLAMLIASLFLPGPFYRLVLVLQLGFYALSVAALFGVKIGPLSRVADPARTFLVLNSAAVIAFINFVTGRKAIWVR